MNLRLRHVWNAVRSSFWFVPACMVLGAVLLASLMIYLDDTVRLGLADRYPRIFGANADGARGILSAIAGSMITVAGVTFSVTIVALSLASNQYTPRILRNYMRDRGNQIVLGMFVSVFVYCILVLRTIRGGEEEFIPSYALLVGMVLGLTAIGFLIFFIHHIATSIQASSILANIYNETIGVINDLSQRTGDHEPTPDGVTRPEDTDNSVDLAAETTGYIQDVNEEALVQWAEKNDVILEMTRGIGEFVFKDAPLLKVLGRSGVNRSIARELNRCYSISTARTIDQDPAYGVRQIVDIALKALSPGINDGTTAVSCIDYLGAILFRMARLQPAPELCCSGQKLRLIARRANFQYLLDLSFNEIRQHAREDLRIYLRLLGALTELASAPAAIEHKAAIWRHARLLSETARPLVSVQADRGAFNEKLATAASVMEMDDAPYKL